MAMNITKLKTRVNTLARLNLEDITFGVITKDGLEHKEIYEETIKQLDEIKSRIKSSYDTAWDSAKDEAGRKAWKHILDERFGGDVAKALAFVGLGTDFNSLSESENESSSSESTTFNTFDSEEHDEVDESLLYNTNY